MTDRRFQWISDERWLVTAGVIGLSASVVYACGGSHPTASSGNTASSASSSGPSSGSMPSATATCTTDPSTATNTAAVVSAVNAVITALTPDQRTAIQYEANLPNAIQWSNFPAAVVRRNGVKLGDMAPEAKAAAEALAVVAAGTTGSTLLNEVRAADDAYAVHATGGQTRDSRDASNDLFGNGNYYVSIHGSPSTTTPWMLQFAGHHLAYNFTYGGKCTSATPLFAGAQPSNWTDSNGTSHAPLDSQRGALAALLASVDSSPGAKLSGTFSDMINGPSRLSREHGGGNDSNFPSGLTYPSGTSNRGVSAGSLSKDHKALLKAAIESWVENVADPVSSALLSAYESDDALANTYVAYAGATDLSTTSSYARIDGPRIWIEFTVQEGTASNPQGHYHAIWRDKIADYGADYLMQ